MVKANFSQTESQSNARKQYSEKYLLCLKEGIVARPNISNLHLLCKTQSLPVVQLWFPPPYLLVYQCAGASVYLVFAITLVMVLLTHTTEKATQGAPDSTSFGKQEYFVLQPVSTHQFVQMAD